MAYTDADLLNIFKGYSYGIAANETKVQGMSSADKARMASLVATDWSVENSTQSANAILSLVDDGVPFSASLLRDVNAYIGRTDNNQANKAYVSPLSNVEDSSPLSITTDLSKYSYGLDNPLATSGNDIVVNQNAINNALGSSFNTSSLLGGSLSSSNITNSSATPLTPQPKNDKRVRISPRAAVFDQMISSSGIMSPLRETYGFMFPITPTINETIETNYDTYDIVHGLMPIQAFKSGGAKVLTVSGTFIAQTDVEARYCLACIHFIRSFSKMNFGDNDPNAGTPPPILVFNAYGDAAFHNIPVIITQASMDWPSDVDYVYTTADSTSGASSVSFKTNVNGSNISARSTGSMIADGWVPSKFTISLTLTVQHTASRLRQFNLESFRNGSLLTGNGGWI